MDKPEKYLSVSVDKDKIIEVRGALIGNLQKQIKEMEKAKAESTKRHSKKATVC